MSAPSSDPPADPPAGSSSSASKPEDSSTAPAATTSATDGDVEMKEDKQAVEEDPYADIPEHIMKGDVETIKLQTRLIDNEVKVN